MGRRDDPEFVPHILRYTCGSRLIQRDVPDRVVQDYLGHKSAAMTRRYAKLNPRQLQAAAAALDTAPVADIAAERKKRRKRVV